MKNLPLKAGQGPRISLTYQALFQGPGCQGPSDQFQEPFVLDFPRYSAYQQLMIDLVEAFFQINIDHPPVSLRYIVIRLRDGLVCPTPRTEPVTVVGKSQDRSEGS